LQNIGAWRKGFELCVRPCHRRRARLLFLGERAKEENFESALISDLNHFIFFPS